MARRYSRREFLTDAGVALAGSVLLKVLAPKTSTTPDHLATAPTAPSPAANQMPFARPADVVAGGDPAHPQCPAAGVDSAHLG